MIIKEAKFITSAANERGFLTDVRPTIAVCGRSNVGKSSFINLLAGRKKLARTSAEPGRTRLVNYFDFGAFILADLPGYGFARVSKAEKDRWAALLDSFFSDPGRISHAFALVDIRHDPTADDKTMISFLYAGRIPFTIVATKSDKLAKTRVREACRLASAFGTGEDNVIALSSVTGRGKEEILTLLDKVVGVSGEIAEE